MKRIRRGTLSAKVLLSVLSVILISFMFLTGVLTYWSYQQMTREYNQVMQAYISNVNSNFSRYMEGMRTLAEKYYNSYEGILARHGDAYQASEHVALISEVREQMEPFYHSVLFLNREGKVSFDSRKGISFADSLRDRVEEMALEQDLGSRPFLWSIRNYYPEKPDIHMLSIYLQEASVGENHYSGSVVVNVDTRAFSQTLFTDSEQESFETYILNQAGYVVAHSEASLLGQNLSKQSHIQDILEKASGSGRVKVDEKWVNLVYRETDYQDYYVVVQSKASGGFWEAMGLMPVGLLLLDFVVSIVLIYILCNRLFRSFNNVTAHMRDAMEEEYNVKKIYDDVQFLEQYHQLMGDYVNRLRLQDEKNLIIKSLLQDTWSREMQRFLVDKKMVLSRNKYAVVIFQIDAGESVNEETIDICKRKRTIVEEVISAGMSDSVKYTCLELGLRRLLLILSENGRFSYDMVQDSLGDICEVLHDKQQIEVQFAMSDIALANEEECDMLYKQAKKRLTMKNAEGNAEAEGDKQTKNRLEAHTNREMLVRVVDYLNNNYQDSEISVSSLAEQFHIQSGYLGRLFQEFTGQSILSYLMDIRMKRARDLLMTCPDMSVAQVSQAVGFGGSAYFTTSFKKYYGVSPSKIWDFNINEEQ